MAKQINQFKKRESQKRKESKPFYSSANWRKLRLMILSEHPICQCGEIDETTGETCQRAATEVHHIEELADNPEKAYEISNLQALSKACHSRETKRRQEQKKKG